jgi:hypothetical protein
VKDDGRKFVHTKHVDESGAWYALDNAGIIMPAVTNSVNTGLFRFEATLCAPIVRPMLEKALTSTSNRFPYFNVRLKRGFFWYYLEQCLSAPHLFPDDKAPCQDWNINESGTRMFRVLVRDKRIAVEFSHALTDGSGAISFLKTLLVEYFRLVGIEPCAPLGEGEFHDIFPVDSSPGAEEHEDGYQRYFPKGLPNPEPNPRAWHAKFPRVSRHSYRIISGRLDLPACLAEARNRGVSLTELLAAVYIDALQTLWFEQSPKPRDHFVSVEIPVNVRKFFPSGTNRNFSLFVLVSENLHLGKRDFNEIVQRVHYQMKLENDPRSIARQISRNAGGARNIIVRMVPLAVKDLFARVLFAKFGETMLSGFISNLGAVHMPPGIAPHIAQWEFIPAPSTTTLTNASAVSWNDELRVSFGSLTRTRELEKLFFRRLRELGLAVRVECRDDMEE